MMRKGRPPRPLEDRIADRLVPEGDCLLWTGYVNPVTGYGQLTLCPANQKRLGTKQRIVTVPWAVCRMAHGPRPKALYVLHSCGRNLCAAAGHLSWGTPLQNIIDSINHGTRRTGEKHPNAKYSNAVVAELRRLVAAGETVCGAGRSLGIPLTYACKIMRGEVRTYPEPIPTETSTA